MCRECATILELQPFKTNGVFVIDALGLFETTGLTPALVALDAMDKAGEIRVVQVEVNDLLGVCIKVRGGVAAVQAALEAGRAVAERMGGQPVVAIIPRPQETAWTAIFSPPEFNPLIQQDVVFFPADPRGAQAAGDKEPSMDKSATYALGLIETQGFTAVFEAIDSACKAANVEVVGKEKLGGGYVTVIIRGDVAAVKAAVEAGQSKVEGLGKLIAAHVIPRPSPSVLSLLPKA